MRYAIWAAVSTAEQARPEKFSIPTQLERATQAAQASGWVETAGPFIVQGQSRTKYIQLAEAAAHIEPLRLMLAAARNGQFDVLVMTEYDRLRELLDQVFRTLASYRIQLYSVAQPIEPVPAAEYNIYKADTVAIMIGMSQIISRQEISRTRRKWAVGMPRRITELGLPAAHIPYGYRKPPGQEHDRKAIPEPNPTLTPHLIALKDLHLSGHSTTQLLEYIHKHKLPTPKSDTWYPQTVRDILRNPFYAGIVQWGKTRVYTDPQTDSRKRDRRIPPSEIQQNTGKHKPLWDLKTHHAILAEYKRRTRTYRGRVNNQFTGLVKCGNCGAAMWRQENGTRLHRIVWRCSASSPKNGKYARNCHNAIPHDILLEKVSKSLVLAIKPHARKTHAPTPPPTKNEDHQQAITELQLKLTRLEDAYLSGHWDLSRYTARKETIQQQLETHQQSLVNSLQQKQQRQVWQQSIQQIQQIENLPHWLTHASPPEVNRALHTILATITVSEEKIELIFK